MSLKLMTARMKMRQREKKQLWQRNLKSCLCELPNESQSHLPSQPLHHCQQRGPTFVHFVQLKRANQNRFQWHLGSGATRLPQMRVQSTRSPFQPNHLMECKLVPALKLISRHHARSQGNRIKAIPFPEEEVRTKRAALDPWMLILRHPKTTLSMENAALFTCSAKLTNRSASSARLRSVFGRSLGMTGLFLAFGLCLAVPWPWYVDPH
mmetsp:Transcript_55833/g.167338  ORF Transcript_55833/g.167338 Transcript_55833/m.167338 type:complete len:209 (-) Transcript_55833:328-954(-)